MLLRGERTLLSALATLATLATGAGVAAEPDAPDGGPAIAIQCMAYLDSTGPAQSAVVSRRFRSSVALVSGRPSTSPTAFDQPSDPLSIAFGAYVHARFPDRPTSGAPFCTVADNVQSVVAQLPAHNAAVSKSGDGFLVELVQADWPPTAVYPAPPPVIAAAAVTPHPRAHVRRSHGAAHTTKCAALPSGRSKVRHLATSARCKRR